MQQIGAVPPRQHNRHVQLDKRLWTSRFVFVRVDAVKTPLKRPYERPYKVIKRTTKHVIINKSGEDTTSIVVWQLFTSKTFYNRIAPTQLNQKSEARRLEDIFGGLSIYQEVTDLIWLMIVGDASHTVL